MVARALGGQAQEPCIPCFKAGAFWPDSASECFGEAIAAYFAQAEGLSSIVVRIGAYDDGSVQNWLRTTPNVRELATYISARDLSQLLVRCIEAPDIGFAIAHGLSENRFKRLDLTATREILGFAPQDDAFAFFGETLSDWLRV